MTKEDWKQMLPIIQAWIEGKPTEIKICDDWIPMELHSYKFGDGIYKYRIKPQPRTFWISKISLEVYDSFPSDGLVHKDEYIKVIEVLD